MFRRACEVLHNFMIEGLSLHVGNTLLSCVGSQVSIQEHL